MTTHRAAAILGWIGLAVLALASALISYALLVVVGR